jgi:hypothetical protein
MTKCIRVTALLLVMSLMQEGNAEESNAKFERRAAKDIKKEDAAGSDRRGKERAVADKSSDADMLSYAEWASVMERVSKTLSPHVTLRPFMTSNTAQDSEESRLYFVIYAAEGEVRVPVEPDGSFEFPVTQDLLRENPQVSLHGFEDGGIFEAAAIFQKVRSEKKEEIPYSEIMLAYTYGAQMQREARARNPDVPVPKKLIAQILIAKDPTEPLVIKSKSGAIVLEPTNKGEYRAPFSPELIDENPAVLFPTNAVRLGSFIFEEPPDAVGAD